MPDYHSTFAEGEKVRIKDKDFLREFQRSWKYHHNVTDEQMEYGGRIDVVKQCGYYHGGDVLIELDDAQGVWHETLLEEALEEGQEFIPASEYYDVAAEGRDFHSDIIITGQGGEEYRVEPEYMGGKHCAKAMEEVAKVRTKEGFESRYRLGKSSDSERVSGNDSQYADGFSTGGREMTDIDKGRLLMTESKKAARAQQLILWLASIAAWCAMLLLFVVHAHMPLDTPEWDLMVYFAANFLLVTGALFGVMALAFRPLRLHENGVDNLQMGLFTRVFKRFDGIERVDIKLKGDWAAIIFQTRGRWRRLSNSMVLEEEDRQPRKLRLIVRFLKYKGQEVSVEDEARKWMGKGG